MLDFWSVVVELYSEYELLRLLLLVVRVVPVPLTDCVRLPPSSSIVSEVPVYLLACTPDERAVTLLKQTLEGEPT